MFRILAIVVTLAASVLAASAAHADVWRFTDAQGRVQYSDRWVPGSVLIKTSSKSPSSAPPQASQQDKFQVSNDSIAAGQQQTRDQRTVQQDVAKTKAEQCQKAKDDYDKSVRARRIFKQTKDGQREYMADADADAYRVQLLNARKAACGS